MLFFKVDTDGDLDFPPSILFEDSLDGGEQLDNILKVYLLSKLHEEERPQSKSDCASCLSYQHELNLFAPNKTMTFHEIRMSSLFISLSSLLSKKIPIQAYLIFQLEESSPWECDLTIRVIFYDSIHAEYHDDHPFILIDSLSVASPLFLMMMSKGYY